MLLGLKLQNIALIETLELDFKPGFTVLTGETGAGKSLLFDALDVLLGGSHSKGGSRLIRSGALNAKIEASFSHNDCLNHFFEEVSIDIDEEIIITRDWKLTDSRLITRSRINGVLVNRNQLLTLRPLLIDFTVQGQIHNISSSEQQMSFLDRFGGQSLLGALQNAQESWDLWKDAKSKLEEALLTWKKLEEEKSFMQDTLKELMDANLEDVNEDKKLQVEEDRLSNGVFLRQGTENILSNLSESTQGIPSAMDNLSVSIDFLKDLLKFDSSLEASYQELLILQNQLQEFISKIQNYLSSLQTDSYGLDVLQQRLLVLNNLKKRYQLDLCDLLLKRDDLRDKCCSDDTNSSLLNLKQAEESCKKKRDEYNSILSDLRIKFGKRLETEIMAYMRPLGLENLRFHIQIDSLDPSRNGIDKVEFQFSANPGQPLAPLSEIASGGEMSRFLLALKTVFSQEKGQNVLFFDEIDSGVSGRVSRSIASALKALSSKCQVFCVTHQPLVAAIADHHFSVSKSVTNGVTKSIVSELQGFQARQHELAELAGGDFVESKAYVASLLEDKAA